MDWATRQMLDWRLSNTMVAEFCDEALNEALARYSKLEIFNTDQGSQFTSFDFAGALKDAGVARSMDGWGCCMGSKIIERPPFALDGRTLEKPTGANILRI